MFCEFVMTSSQMMWKSGDLKTRLIWYRQLIFLHGCNVLQLSFCSFQVVSVFIGSAIYTKLAITPKPLPLNPASLPHDPVAYTLSASYPGPKQTTWFDQHQGLCYPSQQGAGIYVLCLSLWMVTVCHHHVRILTPTHQMSMSLPPFYRGTLRYLEVKQLAQGHWEVCGTASLGLRPQL